MSEVIKEKRIRNEYIRASIGVVSIVDKMRKNRLGLCDHVSIRENLEAVKTIMELSVVMESS